MNEVGIEIIKGHEVTKIISDGKKITGIQLDDQTNIKTNNVITNKYTQQDEPMASAGDAKETIYNKKNNSLSGTRRLLCGIGNQTHHISAEAPWPRWDFLERKNKRNVR